MLMAFNSYIQERIGTGGANCGYCGKQFSTREEAMTHSKWCNNGILITAIGKLLRRL